MAEEKSNQHEQETKAEDAPQQATTTARLLAMLQRWMTIKVLAILLGASVLFHVISFGYIKLVATRKPTQSNGEIALGEFHFVPAEIDTGPVSHAEFSLHIALLDKVDRTARRQITRRKYRVQQDIEELLRKAQGRDFEDPTLGEMKRRLQERINETLGMRAIADVIITNLQLEHKPQEQKTTTDTVEAVPWREEPPG